MGVNLFQYKTTHIILLPRIRNKSGSKITEICPVNYVRREIVQTVLKIGPYR